MSDSLFRKKVLTRELYTSKETLSAILPLSYSSENVVLGSQEGNIEIVDTNKKQIKCQLQGHRNSVNSLLQTKDLLISGASDATIRLWDIETGKFLAFIPEQGNRKRVSYQQKKAAFKMVQEAQSRLEQAGPEHKKQAEKAVHDATRNFSLLGTGLEKRLVPSTTLSEEEEKGSFTGTHSGKISSLVLLNPVEYGSDTSRSSISSTMIASASADSTIKFWSLSEASSQSALLHTIESAHVDAVTGCAAIPGSPYLISVGWDRAIRIWDLRICDCVCEFENAHSDFITSVTLLPHLQQSLPPSPLDHPSLRYTSDSYLVSSEAARDGVVYFATAGWDTIVKIWSFNGAVVAPYFPASDYLALHNKFFTSLLSSRSLSEYSVDLYNIDSAFTQRLPSPPPEEDENEKKAIPFTESKKYSVLDSDDEMNRNASLYKKQAEAVQPDTVEIKADEELAENKFTHEFARILFRFLNSETKAEEEEKTNTKLKQQVFAQVAKERAMEEKQRGEQKEKEWQDLLNELRKKQKKPTGPRAPQFNSQRRGRKEKKEGEKVPLWMEPLPLNLTRRNEVNMKEWLLMRADKLFGKGRIPTDEELNELKAAAAQQLQATDDEEQRNTPSPVHSPLARELEMEDDAVSIISTVATPELLPSNDADTKVGVILPPPLVPTSLVDPHAHLLSLDSATVIASENEKEELENTLERGIKAGIVVRGFRGEHVVVDIDVEAMKEKVGWAAQRKEMRVSRMSAQASMSASHNEQPATDQDTPSSQEDTEPDTERARQQWLKTNPLRMGAGRAGSISSVMVESGDKHRIEKVGKVTRKQANVYRMKPPTSLTAQPEEPVVLDAIVVPARKEAEERSDEGREGGEDVGETEESERIAEDGHPESGQDGNEIEDGERKEDTDAEGLQSVEEDHLEQIDESGLEADGNGDEAERTESAEQAPGLVPAILPISSPPRTPTRSNIQSPLLLSSTSQTISTHHASGPAPSQTLTGPPPQGYVDYGASLLRSVIASIPAASLNPNFSPTASLSELRPFVFEESHLLSARSMHSVMHSGHTSFITSLAPFGDASMVLSTSSDGTVSVWNALKGERVFSNSDNIAQPVSIEQQSTAITRLSSGFLTRSSTIFLPSLALDPIVKPTFGPILSASPISSYQPFSVVAAAQHTVLLFE
ncbi:hypothetical protein BLNAU_19430 [Blattamonas nauphoetae]|uniref:WD40 repeat-like protein n=1 Tax=Blattamonas nauphoetae TaxID=2049346 RepID=A0ABQ9X206_9EUKA|nr:hypothetical protein BLNAU_19430 [Blattamonas nauphoetae]